MRRELSMALARLFEEWRADAKSDGDPRDCVRLRYVDEDEVAPCVALTCGGFAVQAMVPSEEGATFFVESDSGNAMVEEWVCDVNSYFAEKPSATLGDLLGFMARTLPAKLRANSEAPAPEGTAEEEEEDVLDDCGLMPEVDEASIRAEDVDGEERRAKRQALVDEQRWEQKVERSLEHSQSSRQASQTLMREMVGLQRLHDQGRSASIEIELVNDSLYHWRISLPADGFPDDCVLKKDLVDYARRSMRGGDSSGGIETRKAGVLFDVVFPQTFPFAPPFIRVVYPRFKFHTGHVTVGGSICMELLTAAGWLPTFSVESVFVQIRAEMISGNGRVDFDNPHDYTESEAHQAFDRVARQHGWLK